MSDCPLFDVTDLDAEVYLLSPPETVWNYVLLVDHATWFDFKDMEVLKMAQDQTREFGEDIPREAWLGLYAPTNPLKKVSPEGMNVTHSIFKRAGDMPEWQRLRSCVNMDPVAAAFGAAHFSVELISKLPPEVKEKMQESQRDHNEANHLHNQIQQLQMVVQSFSEGDHNGYVKGSASAGVSGQPINGNIPTLEELEREIDLLRKRHELAQKKARNSVRQAVDAMEKSKARMEHAMAESMFQSVNDLSDLQDAAGEFGFGWGLSSSGGVSREQLEGLQEFAYFLRKSKNIKMILDMLGWAKKMVSRERRKIKRGRERFTHFQTQDLDLETLAPQELIAMTAFPEGSFLHTEFLCRALDGDLLHSQFEGQESAGRGPMVYLRDESGSMSGWKRAVSCAVQLALMLEARRERRRFVSIPFSGVGQFEVYDPGHLPDPMELVEHLEHTYKGGTEPYAPLKEAIQLIKDDPSMKSGDILCLTDGAFGSPPDDFLELLNQAREDPGLKVVAVVINGRPGQADFADKVVMVSDIFRDKEKLADAIAPLL